MASSNLTLELYEASMLGKSSLASLLERAQKLAAQLELAPLPDELEADQEMTMMLMGNNYDHRLKRFQRLESKLSEMRAAVAQLGSADDAKSDFVNDDEVKENVDVNLPKAQKKTVVDTNTDKSIEAKDDNVDKMEEDEESNTSLPILLPKTPSKNKAKPRTEQKPETEVEPEEEEDELLVRRSTRIAAKQSADVGPPEPVRATRRTTRVTAANKKRADAPLPVARVTRQTNTRASNNKRRHVDGDASEHSFEATPDGKKDPPAQTKDSEEASELKKESSISVSTCGEGKRKMSEDEMEEDGFRSCETSFRSAEKKNFGSEDVNKERTEEEDMELDDCDGTSSLNDVDQDGNNERSQMKTSQSSQSIKDSSGSRDEQKRCEEISDSNEGPLEGQNEKQPEASNTNNEETASVASNSKDLKLAPSATLMASKRNPNHLVTSVAAPGSGCKFVTSKFSFIQKDPVVSKAAPAKEDVQKQREEALKSKEEHRQAILAEQQKLKRRILEERRQENEEKMRRAEEKRRQQEEEMRNKAIKKQEKITETERFNKAKETLVAKERKRAEEDEKTKREQLKQRLLWEEKKAQLEKTEQQQQKEQQKQQQHQSQASSSMFQMLVKKQKQKKEAEVAQSSSSNLNSTFTIENENSSKAKAKVAGAEEKSESSNMNVKSSNAQSASTNLNSTFTVGKDKNGKATRDSVASVSESYDITPAHHELPPENLEDSQNYDINDIKSDDDTDDEDQPKKKIPSWASGAMLRNALLSQAYTPPDLDALFGVMSLEGVRLEVIFREHRKRFFKRTSSACWDQAPITNKFH